MMSCRNLKSAIFISILKISQISGNFTYEKLSYLNIWLAGFPLATKYMYLVVETWNVNSIKDPVIFDT